MVSHVIAFGTWFGIVEPDMSGDCEDVTTYDTEEALCGEVGARLAIAAFALHFIVGCFGIFVNVKLLKSK
jgi:hypothetical protein